MPTTRDKRTHELRMVRVYVKGIPVDGYATPASIQQFAQWRALVRPFTTAQLLRIYATSKEK